MTKHIITTLAALFLSVVAPASPVTVSNDALYASRFQDKGVISGAIFTDTVSLTYESFGFEAKAYAPTLVGIHDFRTALSRLDLTGSYTFKSTLLDVTLGDTSKHYTHPSATSVTDRNQPFVKLQFKGLPLSFIARYDIPTRNLNTEAGIKQGISVGSFKVTPSAYVGYSDISDQFPHSLKAIKQSNRYYGGGVALSHSLLGGTALIGGYVNRSDLSFQNTTFFWTTGYSLRF